MQGVSINDVIFSIYHAYLFFVTMDAIAVNAVGTYLCVEFLIGLENAYLFLITMDTNYG